MKQSVGYTVKLNFIIIFIFLSFAFLAGTYCYARAFKVNTLITTELEKYEGYNDLSKAAIETDLGNVGYSVIGVSTAKTRTKTFKKNGGTVTGVVKNSKVSGKYQYIIYEYAVPGTCTDSKKTETCDHVYGITKIGRAHV